MTAKFSVDQTPDATPGPHEGHVMSHRWPLPTFRADIDGSRPIDLGRTLRVARDAVVIALAVAAAVSVTAAFFSTPTMTTFFLPSAVVLLAFLATKTRAWWGVIASAFVGYWVASAVAGAPADAWGGSLATAIATPLIGAAIIRRWLRPASELDSLTWIGSFIAVALLAPIVTEGAGTWLVGDPVPPVLPPPDGVADDAATPWLVIVLANALALLTIVPASLAAWHAYRRFAATPSRDVRGPRIVEGIALAAACAVASALILRRGGPLGHLDAVFLVAPALVTLWGALRFGIGGAAFTLFVATAVAMYDATTRHGAASGFATSDVVALQLTMATLAVPFLLLSAAATDRRRISFRCTEEEDRSAAAARAGGVYLTSFNEMTDTLELDLALGESLGLSASDMDRPNWWWRHVQPDDARALRAFWAARQADENRPHLDFRMLDADGHVRWFRSRVHHTGSDMARSRHGALVGTVTDVTHLKHAELVAVERSRELAHVARTAIVGELAAALTHEVRQPLTAILINSQTAMRVLDARPHDPEAVREILQQLAADGRRAGDVIQRVRGFARKAEPERGPVDINDVVREATQLVRHDTIRRRVEIRFALAPEPLVIVGDRVQLQQVVLNLLLNALDALAELPADAERRISIETTHAPRSGLITVRDTGPGIPKERQTAIFEPFVTTKRTGLGMGLAISRIIVAAHGGGIEVESEPGAGAAFIVTVPLGAATSR